MAKKLYIATRTGWVAGRFVNKGAQITLTEAAARHEHVAPAPKPRRPRQRSK